VLASALLIALLASGCGITRVDAPVTFSADHRLKVEAPKPEAAVHLPVEVRWSVSDFPRRDGNHFGLFVDRVPVGPKRSVRLRICTEGEKLPPQLGSTRKLCKDDRKSIYFASGTSFRVKCFEPRFTAPARTRNTHTVAIVLLDRNDRRVGEAVQTVRFRVDAAESRRCRGLS
jgi:hypothetical protein